MNTKNALEISNLTKKYGNQIAVNKLNLNIESGKIFGFLGPNGAGKTTTLKMLAGLTSPLEGEIRILGNKCTFGSVKGREKVGFLPDVPECYGYMKPMEYLKFCGDLYGLNDQYIKDKSKEVLELVGLFDINKKIGAFSRGMKQRMGIAQALINEPELILMDEPASALDPTGRYEVMEILNRLKGKTTVFFSTHIITDVEKVCDEIAIINNGVILEQGAIEDLKIKYDKKEIGFSLATPISEIKKKEFLDKLSSYYWCEEIVKTNNSWIKIRVTDRSVAQREVISILSQLSIGLEKFDSLAISLEDIFLEVVKK